MNIEQPQHQQYEHQHLQHHHHQNQAQPQPQPQPQHQFPHQPQHRHDQYEQTTAQQYEQEQQELLSISIANHLTGTGNMLCPSSTGYQADCGGVLNAQNGESLGDSVAPPDTMQAYNLSINMNRLPPPPIPVDMDGSMVGTTNSFKTPLLPMPSLADIEGEMLLTAAATTTDPQITALTTMPTPTPTLTATLAPTTTPAPTSASETGCASISNNRLRYSNASSPPPTTTTATSAAIILTQQHPSIVSSFCNEDHLQQQQQQHQHQQDPQTQSRILATQEQATEVVLFGNGNNCTPPAILTKANITAKPIDATDSNSHLRSTECCTCFGAHKHRRSSKLTKGRRRRCRHGSQSLCFALFTNLGMCALLLAYTLLGSFIFLAIENEHPPMFKLAATATFNTDTGTVLSNNGNNAVDEDEYMSSHQMYSSPTSAPVKFFDNINGMPDNFMGTPSHSTFGNRYDNTAYSNGKVNASSTADHRETTKPQPTSSDIYEVRQRTIENIWDITVSLNILYKENWTKLAALEIAKFQDQLITRLNRDAMLHLSYIENGTDLHVGSPATEAMLLHRYHGHNGHGHEWSFAKAFLYSVTVLTTIGYGNVAPRTTLGRLVTLAYAIFGIPLTLVYLSSTGGILAKIAREVFSKALCCCLCSNCGYCCYDEKRMAEKERRMKRKRQLEELRRQQATLQEPYYVRSGSIHDSHFAGLEKQMPTPATHTPNAAAAQTQLDTDSLSATESRSSIHGLSILAPILLCLSMMIIYIVFGAVVMLYLEQWSLLDGIYFCFMSLSTIGFGDMLLGLRRESAPTIWFCSIYILSGMALTAMCFNVIHEEIVHRIKIVVEFKKGTPFETKHNDTCFHAPPPP